MACRQDIQSFLDKRLSYTCAANGQTYTYTIRQYAQWVSYQSNTDGISGYVSAGLIVAHWGNETAWGTSTGFANKNLAGMKFTCDYAYPRCGDWIGTDGITKFATFCNWRDSVRAYSQLLRIGYQHVAYAYQFGEGTNSGYRAGAVALGQGYRTNYSFTTNYCIEPTQTFSSSNRRPWDAAGYNNGGGPGSSLYNTIAANDCLYNLGVQTTNPNVYMC